MDILIAPSSGVGFTAQLAIIQNLCLINGMALILLLNILEIIL